MGEFEEMRLARRMEAACEARRSDERVATAGQVADAVSPGLSVADRRRLSLIVRKKRVEAWFADRMGMSVEAWRDVEAAHRRGAKLRLLPVTTRFPALAAQYRDGRLR